MSRRAPADPTGALRGARVHLVRGEEDLTLTELDLDEMIALWLSFDHHRRRTGFILSASTLGEIIEAELGPTVEFEN